MTVQSLHRTDKLESLGESLMILDVARAETMKRARHLQHPLFCLDAIRTGVEQGGAAGLQAVRACGGQCPSANRKARTYTELLKLQST